MVLYFAAVLAITIMGVCLWAVWSDNKDLRERLWGQEHWLVRLDERFDHLSLELMHLREDENPPSDEEVRRCEESLVGLLDMLMQQTVVRPEALEDPVMP